MSLLRDQVKALALTTDELKRASDPLGKLSTALQQQLAILREEQKRRNEELEQKPRLQVLLGGVALAPGSKQVLPSSATSGSVARFEVTLRNFGPLYAQDVRLLAKADKPFVDLGCKFASPPTMGGRINRPNQGECVFEINYIGHDWLENAEMTASYPPASPPFDIDFSFSATNYPKRGIGSVLVRPRRES